MHFYILFNTFLVIASCFLTWIEPKIFVIEMRGIDMVDGQVVFVLGAIGFMTCIFEMLRKKRKFFWVYGMVGFLISIITAVIFFNYYQNDYRGGPGIYLSALSGIQLTGTYILHLTKSKSA